MTAPFIREFADAAWVSRVQAQFDALNVTTSFVWLYCDEATMHPYMRQRGAARGAVKLADWAAYLRTINIDLRPPVPHHLLDNSASSTPWQAQAQELVRKLAAGAA